MITGKIKNGEIIFTNNQSTDSQILSPIQYSVY